MKVKNASTKSRQKNSSQTINRKCVIFLQAWRNIMWTKLEFFKDHNSSSNETRDRLLNHLAPTPRLRVAWTGLKGKETPIREKYHLRVNHSRTLRCEGCPLLFLKSNYTEAHKSKYWKHPCSSTCPSKHDGHQGQFDIHAFNFPKAYTNVY